MPAPDLVVRPGTPADTEGILDLMKESLGEGKIPRRTEYWCWKHLDNPFGASPVLLATARDRIVGLRVFMRWGWRAGDRELPAVRAVDTATHPEWQGRGIFSRLTLALLEQVRREGAAFVFNTPNSKSRPGYLKMGWVAVGRTSLWLRPLVGRRKALAGHGHSVAEMVEDPAFSRFAAALPSDHRLSTPLSPGYLRWRYADIPGFAYEAAWRVQGQEGAAAIFRILERGRFRELRLCQLLVGGGRESLELARELLRSLLDGSPAHYASAMAAQNTEAQKVLMRSGFLPAPMAGPIMTVRPLAQHDDVPDPGRRGSWQLSIGDLELF